MRISLCILIFTHTLTIYLLDWRPYVLALIAGWGGALFGYDSAFIGGTIDLPVFQSQFGLDGMSADQLAFTSSNIVSTYQAGE